MGTDHRHCGLPRILLAAETVRWTGRLCVYLIYHPAPQCVALIQSLLAGLGFLAVRLPGAGLWALLFLIAAVLQMASLALIPAVIYVFATTSAAKAVAFLIWCIVVALIDNVLKPLLLGRGVPVPITVVFLGAIGGFLATGIIGLFVGPIVLSVGYKLFLAWLDADIEIAPDAPRGHCH
jgi:predicted PurR-regulated permease PerM